MKFGKVCYILLKPVLPHLQKHPGLAAAYQVILSTGSATLIAANIFTTYHLPIWLHIIVTILLGVVNFILLLILITMQSAAEEFELKKKLLRKML